MALSTSHFDCELKITKKLNRIGLFLINDKTKIPVKSENK